jgi:DNA-binding CsgD family transcriptional regulator
VWRLIPVRQGALVSLGYLGLDPLTESVYQTLLAHPEADLAGICGLAGVTLVDVRAALDRLVQLSLVRWQADDVAAPTLNDPAAALAVLLAQEQSEIKERQLRMEVSRSAIMELLAARASGDAQEIPDVERLVGVEAVRDRLEALARTCQEEVWSFNQGGPQSVENLARSRPLNRETLDRGIRMRAIYLDSVRNDEPSHQHLRALVDEGAEVRTVPILPLRMIIVDRTLAVVPMDDRNSALGALVVSGRGMIAGLVALFLATWKSATPFGPRQARDPDLPSTQERTALRLWARGATDAMVARSLGTSERTVRRISEVLAERLGARSRFEAGARALSIGWLTEEDLT